MVNLHKPKQLTTSRGQDRQEFKDGFRRVALSVKAGSPKTEMMWAPNWFDCTGKPNDYDPYGPWYPGDDVVDWVAMSFYFFSHQYPYVNDNARPNHFINGITGNQGTCSPQSQFYQRFARAKNKKFAMAETGAPWIEGQGGIAGSNAWTRMRSWWTQLFNSGAIQQFPLFQLILWFEYRKFEDSQMREFRIGSEQVRLVSFRNDLSSVSNVLYLDKP
jgi:hypothetical protein